MNEKETTVIDHFDQRSSEWSALYAKPVFQQRLRLFAESIGELVPAPKSVLDFGCGSGVISCELARRGYNITGVDAAPGMVQSARDNASKLGISGIEFRVTDPVGSELPDAYYDAVICSSVLEYVAEERQLVENLIRTIKPGGTLLISVPNAHSLVGLIEDMLVSLKVRSRGKTADVHFANKRYSTQDIADMFGGNGKREIKTTYFELPLFGKLGEMMSQGKYFGVLALVNVSI